MILPALIHTDTNAYIIMIYAVFLFMRDVPQRGPTMDHDTHIQHDAQLNYIYQRFNQNVHAILPSYLKQAGLHPNDNQLNDSSIQTITFVRNPWSRLVSVFTFFFVQHSENLKKYGYDWTTLLHAIISQSSSQHPQAFFTFRELVNVLYNAKKTRDYTMCLFGNTHFLPQSYAFNTVDYDVIYDYTQASTVIHECNQTLSFDYQQSTHLHRVDKQQTTFKCVADIFPNDFNVRGIPHYQHFYDDDLIEKVAFIYSEDIDRFGFSFDQGYRN